MTLPPLFLKKKLFLLVASGVVFLVSGILFGRDFFLPESGAVPEVLAASTSLPEVTEQNVTLEKKSCQPVTRGFRGFSFEENVSDRMPVSRRYIPPQPAFVKITKNMKNPNSIRIPLSQAPSIAGAVRTVNGRKVCAHKNDRPHKSFQGKDVHIDRQCCLDPDEIPNPRCYYPELGW